MRSRSHQDPTGALVIPLLLGRTLWSIKTPACRQKGWWKRGDVEVKLNTVNMTAWVHKECDNIEEETITKLQEAWDNSEQKDECIVRLNDLEGAYWMGTEIGQLGGY
jgi:hypothetical protein